MPLITSCAEAFDAWEFESVSVAAEEGYLKTWMPQGLVMSPDPGNRPSQLVGDLHAVFNDAAKQATIPGSMNPSPT